MSIKRPYLIAGALSFVAISTLCLSSVSADTNKAQDNVAVSVPVSCTMNGTGMTSHTANIPNGTYESEIGTTTLKSFCNDSQGFAIYAIGYTNEEYGNTNLIGTSGGQTIVTGTATTTGNPDVSNWAVKLATDSTATYPLTLDNSFGSYSNVPSSYTKVAHRDSGTDLGSSATGAELTTTYAAYISKGQKADTYDGKVKFTLVHPSSEVPLQPVACEAGKICYNANGNNVVGEMGRQELVKAKDWSSCYYTDYETYCVDSNYQMIDINTLPESDNYIDPVLWASNFSRVGYGFAGWNDAFDYSGNYYGPNQTVAASADTSTNGLSLYAVWVKSVGAIQNWSGCNSLTQGAVTALTDSRDNNTYAVAKLADGKCWMIENLRLDNTALHNSDGTLAQGYNSSFIGLANPEFDNYTDSTTANSLYSIDGSTDVTISGSTQGYRFPRYNNFNTNSRQSSSNYSIDNNTYSYGNYYTWPAAIADTSYYNTENQSITSTSLCPTGWRLPKSGNKSNEANNDFWTLAVVGLNNGINPANYNGYSYPFFIDEEAVPVSNALRSYPNNFLYAGIFYNSSSPTDRGSNGYYWSSTTRDGLGSLILGLKSSYGPEVNPGTVVGNKYNGQSIRCLADT